MFNAQCSIMMLPNRSNRSIEMLLGDRKRGKTYKSVSHLNIHDFETEFRIDIWIENEQEPNRSTFCDWNVIDVNFSWWILDCNLAKDGYWTHIFHLRSPQSQPIASNYPHSDIQDTRIDSKASSNIKNE